MVITKSTSLSPILRAVLGLLGIFVFAVTAADIGDKPEKVAFLSFRIIHDALEPVSDAEKNGTLLLEKILVEKN